LEIKQHIPRRINTSTLVLLQEYFLRQNENNYGEKKLKNLKQNLKEPALLQKAIITYQCAWLSEGMLHETQGPFQNLTGHRPAASSGASPISRISSECCNSLAVSTSFQCNTKSGNKREKLINKEATASSAD
jgi:hypothetical protein